jgi:2-succinyl-5-enolpyruvyl-6-hydroxy-3-cyclohexene-1-carboxylate synthase
MSAQDTFAATLVDEWARSGLTDAVVAPGSRSTPLVAALAADGRLRLHVVLDERSAGFVALGIGLSTGRAAPVVVTSGTAAVELHPAVVEADQAGVPLLAVTADRPPELQRVGAPQTVVQTGLYGSSVRFSADPGVPDGSASGWWRSLAARLVAETVRHPCGPGPVHLNVGFRDPLLGDPGRLPPGRDGGSPWHESNRRRSESPSAELVSELAGAAGSEGLVVAGGGAGEAALRLAETLGWPLLADPRSGARVDHPLVVAAADALLRVPEVAGWRPHHVLRLGRPWASKVLGLWLAGLPITTRQLVVDASAAWSDPERASSVVSGADPSLLADAVVAVLARRGGPVGGVTDWACRWQLAESAAQAAIDGHLAGETAITEAGVARTVTEAVPDGSWLLASSSMPVRDVEWYGKPREGLTVVANRGANGIDGVVATAIGVSVGAAVATTALVGDLAFLYDAGALLGAPDRPANLSLVVVDNNGGGIFSFLAQATEIPAERFERLWGTPHGLDLTAVAASYGVPARRVADLAELRSIVSEPPAGVSVAVVSTDRRANVVAHDRLNAAIAGAVRATVGG